ncbi:MAG: hypothetical protein COA43_16045 [Robiginitomaculum sp.]|nr:MAG: hypothetical protein COA43_16045 [Robiginitomaculum sp.]
MNAQAEIQHELKAKYPTSAQINRAMSAAKKGGMKIGGIEVKPDGSILVLSPKSHLTDPAKEKFFED